MNRIDQLFQNKQERILNMYFTAGFPERDDTARIIRELAEAGVDLIEIGMPYSDPLADGPTIQASSERALANGIHLELIFSQIEEARKTVSVPLILMGYFNQVMQYGVEAFVKRCAEIGVDGFILPDLPPDIYQEQFQDLFQKYGLGITFLISPMTSEERIRQIDELSHGFIYMVSSSSITGGTKGMDAQEAYFQRINAMELKRPRLIGFGISTNKDFELVCRYASGAIVGSAFIRALERGVSVPDFVGQLLQNVPMNP